jgi:hypothetical protein
VITVKVLTKERIPSGPGPEPAVWLCDLELTDEQDTYCLSTSAPIDTEDLLAYFQTRSDGLWEARRKGHVDYQTHVSVRKLLRAALEMLMIEINALRVDAGLPKYSAAEWRQKLKDQLEQD